MLPTLTKTCRVGVFLLCILCVGGCGPSFQQIPLRKDYELATKKSVAIYVAPSGQEILDDTYMSTLWLHFQSFGYEIINTNHIMRERSESPRWVNHRLMADSLIARSYLPPHDILVVVRPKWETIMVITEYKEQEVGLERHVSVGFLPSMRLSSEVMLFDRNEREPLMASASLDTLRWYIKTGEEGNYAEFPWMVIARQIERMLGDLPVCKVDHSSPATHQLDVSLWVDNSYREAFHQEWKERLTRRFLYVNDILRQQLDLELKITEFVEWNSKFSGSLDATLSKLIKESSSGPEVLRIGITWDDRLRTHWTQRSMIGLAAPLSTHAIITAQPSFPDMGYWNRIEEALTIVHEVGHLLGAIHVPDERSVMFPHAGSLFHQFDPVNQRIIRGMKGDFLRRDRKGRLQQYIRAVAALRNTPARDSLAVLESITRAALGMHIRNPYHLLDRKKVNTVLSETIPDSALVHGAIGFVEFRLNRLEHARTHLRRALELNPDFVEAHWYLSRVLSFLGDTEVAETHRQVALPYRKLWVMDD
jgi:tetratricopeptide (TPR) repeat protein